MSPRRYSRRGRSDGGNREKAGHDTPSESRTANAKGDGCLAEHVRNRGQQDCSRSGRNGLQPAVGWSHPATTPVEIVKRLRSEVLAALNHLAARERLYTITST
ncbi:MAG: hypothetical protein V4684_09765 [Pseudomonadota bacterium]